MILSRPWRDWFLLGTYTQHSRAALLSAVPFDKLRAGSSDLLLGPQFSRRLFSPSGIAFLPSSDFSAAGKAVPFVRSRGRFELETEKCPGLKPKGISVQIWRCKVF